MENTTVIFNTTVRTKVEEWSDPFRVARSTHPPMNLTMHTP